MVGGENWIGGENWVGVVVVGVGVVDGVIGDVEVVGVGVRGVIVGESGICAGVVVGESGPIRNVFRARGVPVTMWL